MAVAPDWVRSYCGIPFAELGLDRKGCNCWGLVRLVYAEQLGIDLPAYAGDYRGASRADAADIAALVSGGLRVDGWQPIDWRAADDTVCWDRLRVFDGVLFRIAGDPMHMGVIVAPRLMLHTMRNEDAHPEQIDTLRWKSRITGFYRHSRTIR